MGRMPRPMKEAKDSPRGEQRPQGPKQAPNPDGNANIAPTRTTARTPFHTTPFTLPVQASAHPFQLLDARARGRADHVIARDYSRPCVTILSGRCCPHALEVLQPSAAVDTRCEACPGLAEISRRISTPVLLLPLVQSRCLAGALRALSLLLEEDGAVYLEPAASPSLAVVAEAVDRPARAPVYLVLVRADLVRRPAHARRCVSDRAAVLRSGIVVVVDELGAPEDLVLAVCLRNPAAVFAILCVVAGTDLKLAVVVRKVGRCAPD